jgi:hypothetical protein
VDYVQRKVGIDDFKNFGMFKRLGIEHDFSARASRLNKHIYKIRSSKKKDEQSCRNG